MMTSFWDKTLIIFFLIFPPKCFSRKKIQISLSVTMNPGLMWQFECCREQQSLPFKTGHANSTANADTWYIQIQSSFKDEEGQVDTAFIKTNLYWKKAFSVQRYQSKAVWPIRSFSLFLALLSFSSFCSLFLVLLLFLSSYIFPSFPLLLPLFSPLWYKVLEKICNYNIKSFINVVYIFVYLIL